MSVSRLLRIAAVFAAALAVLYLRFAAGLVRVTEADPFVHWALLAVGILLSLAASAFELNDSGPVNRRDSLFGLGAALVSFAVLRFVGAV